MCRNELKFEIFNEFNSVQNLREKYIFISFSVLIY